MRARPFFVFLVFISSCAGLYAEPSGYNDECFSMYLEKPPLLSGGGTLVFVNDCPYERFLNVCTVDERGEPKLHESARRIPGYGSMRIFVQSGRRLEAVIYSSDRYEPGIPHPCLGL